MANVINELFSKSLNLKPLNGRKIRILEFSNQRGLGGTDKDSQAYMKYYDRSKFEVLAASWRGGERVKWIEDNGIDNLVESDPEKMAAWIKSKNIDVVHFSRMGSQESVLVDTFKAAGVPILIERNAFALFDPSADRAFINKHLLCSEASRAIYKQRAAVYEAQKVEVVYCPTDISRFDIMEPRDWALPIFGRHSRKDNGKWDVINLHALPIIKKAIPNMKFHVIGLTDELREYAKQLGVYDLIVEFPSSNDDSDIVKFLNGITIFAHSSRMGESFGNNIAEAMCAGLPVVTHTGGDSAQCELVTSGHNGYVVNYGDVESYAAGIVDLLSNPEKKKAMGELGKKRAFDNFDARIITKRLEEIYVEELSKISQMEKK